MGVTFQIRAYICSDTFRASVSPGGGGNRGEFLVVFSSSSHNFL